MMLQETFRQPKVSARAEHISLDSNVDESAAASKVRPRRKVRFDYALHSKLRGCSTELRILEDHFLSVQSLRPAGGLKKYELDLRFLNAKPVIVREVAWFWLALAVCLALLSAAGLSLLWPTDMTGWMQPGPLTAMVAAFASAGSALMFLRCTTESLEFTSVHGAVTLVSVTGAIGSARGGKAFFIELIKSINAAKISRPQPTPQFLRDEMREHHRLRESGALSEAQYEAGKARILASH